MKELRKAVNIILNNQDLLSFDDPADIDDILFFQEKFDVKLPNSYKNFLLNIGYLVFGSDVIFGIKDSTLLNMVEDLRALKVDPIPLYLIPIYDLGNGELYCLDTSKIDADGECPVVGWYFGRIEKLYDNFGAFLLEIVKEEILSK